MHDPFLDDLTELRAHSLHRRLREMTVSPDGTVAPVGRTMLNFASNDYLGLSGHPVLREAAKAAIDEYGVGAGSSRLVCGTLPVHLRLEERLARFKGTEAALSFSSGYAAAHGALSALAGPDDVVILDKLAHACLIDAARSCRATLRVFPHNHLGKLESLLQWAQAEHEGARVIICTVFSMDGDRAPVRDLVALKKRYGALLLLDEAHAVGVIGKNGRGLAHECEVSREVDVLMGTMSKSLGVSGGYLAGRHSLIDLLINRARSFVFSTAQPPAMAAAATAAIDYLMSDEGEQRRLSLWQNIRHLAAQLPKNPGQPERAVRTAGSAIFPWIIGPEALAVEVSARLADRGFLAPAIRYPTVARGSARLRLTVTARHTPDQITALGAAMGELASSLRP